MKDTQTKIQTRNNMIDGKVVIETYEIKFIDIYTPDGYFSHSIKQSEKLIKTEPYVGGYL